ncbi:transcription termination factor NusA, partial [Candidatus Woesebacteria bacterium RBG_16_39_8b]
FAQALRAIASERGLDASVIIESIKQAIIAAYRRDAKEHGDDTEEVEFEVELNPTSGEAKSFSWPEGKEKQKKNVTPPGFGRIAAQTAKQVIHQKIREAEKDAIMGEFSGRVGSLISGMILRFDGPNVRVDLGRTEGLMPAEERVPNERLDLNQRMSFLLKEIKETPKGKLIILSRSSPEFVKKLFTREVPEMSSGSVEVKLISREAGVRTKIAVSSSQSGVDPVGSCVGQKGVRVQAVTNELGGERVDIIPWNEDISELIKASLAPAEGLSVSLNEEGKFAKVKAPEDQLSMAIGREGQNARLAAKLSGWKIEIEGIPSPEGQKDEKTSDKPGSKEVVEVLEEKGKKKPKSKPKKDVVEKNEKVKKSKSKPKPKKEKTNPESIEEKSTK